MKRTLILIILAAFSCAFAQDKENMTFQTAGAAVWAEKAVSAPVPGAPYTATITNESIQTLADGNRIVENSTGTIARDSQGRTRRDMPLPNIGNLSAEKAPHLVFIQDPVAQISYILNLTDKTAQKVSMRAPLPPGPGPAGGPDRVYFQMDTAGPAGAPPLPPPPFVSQKIVIDDQAPGQKEDLGTQTMEGVDVHGVRTTRTIAAGQIGNERPIIIVTEVWSSPDLGIVYSKRSDPRMGEQTFRLTNIERAEPDPSLFTVPADFKIVEGPRPIIYRRNQ